MKLHDRVIAVTGAASGIGRALAQVLSSRGCHLALSDVNDEGLAETVASLRGDRRVTSRHLDVSNREEVHAWADEVETEFGQVHGIINNAGVGLAAPIRDMTYEDFEWLMGINFWGVIHGTKAFLPKLEAAGVGHVVNVSSVYGLMGVPTQGAYNAAKFAVRGFTECLRQELDMAGGKIGATSVHPGGIKTNIARAARLSDSLAPKKEKLSADFDKMARTTPEAAAEKIVRGIEKNAPRVLIGNDALLVDVTTRLMPTGYQRIVRRMWGKRS